MAVRNADSFDRWLGDRPRADNPLLDRERSCHAIATFDPRRSMGPSRGSA
jgi:hypothetical protein